MNELNDDQLAEHLRRRTTEAPNPAALTAAITRRLDAVRQVAPWRLRLAGRRGPALSGAVAIIAVVAVAYGSGLMNVSTAPATSPSAPGPTATDVLGATPGPKGDVTILSLDELERVLESGRWFGRTVLADVIIRTDVNCVDDAECPGVVDSSDPLILVDGMPGRGRESPVALRVSGERRVDLVGYVTPPEAPATLWTIPALTTWLGAHPLPANVYAVEGWLTEGFALPCPAPVDPTAPPDFDYGCGIFSWLAPTQVESPRDQAPEGSIRVQNYAYEAFAVRADGKAAFGVYVVEGLISDTLLCLACPRQVLRVIGRVDPIGPDVLEPTSSARIGPIAIRTILNDPTWNGAPVPDDDVELCSGASDCGSTPQLYPGIEVPLEDVDFSAETMLRIVRGTPQSATWDGSALQLIVNRRAAGFWEGALAIDIGDMPSYQLIVKYVVCIPSGGSC